MWTLLVALGGLFLGLALSEPQTIDATFPTTITPSTIAAGSASLPTGSYITYTSQEIASTKLPSSNSLTGQNTVATSNASSTVDPLLITGPSASPNTSTTTAAPLPSNTQPCNGHPEFCSKRYMNITQVCAHNSAFVKKNNAATNQEIGIIGQLNDGVRMIQGETHYVNGTIRSCHTSCDILDAGPLADELTMVREWVEQHPYDVVTILLVNSDFANVGNYTSPIMDAGLGPYLFEPSKIPMHRDDWPTFQDIILSGKRVVIFMDYQANQTQVPYIMDEFSQMWETPFSPTDISFPCDQQRPPGLNSAQQDLVPYLANHNLNLQLSFGFANILIPNFVELQQVNSVNGLAGQNNSGSLGLMADQCLQRWGRPPAWLLVDFYNYGDFNGSVFEIAARMNNVSYNPGTCCGENINVNEGAGTVERSREAFLLAFGIAIVLGAWSST